MIQVAYDLQAGSYTRKAIANPDFEMSRGKAFSKVINDLGEVKSMVDAGVGEGTSMTSIIKHLEIEPKIVKGFDISLSRVAFARDFLQSYSQTTPEFAVGDIQNAPLASNSCELVYTVHALEPNGGNEEKLLAELYRITNRFLVLFEPSYELGNSETKKHIENHNFVRGLLEHASGLGGEVLEHKVLFDSNPWSSNNTAVTVIEKKHVGHRSGEFESAAKWACPFSKEALTESRGCYFSEETGLAYPIVDGFPLLLRGKSILASYISSI
tara:strand:+ start:192 stop:998 length:807 start_codon:yes stop_codon:yes gene_type:complete